MADEYTFEAENPILQRVEALQSFLEDSKTKMSGKGNWGDFHAWLDKQENKVHDDKGIRRSTIESLILDLRQILISLSNTGVKPDREQKRKLDNLEASEDKARAFKNAVEAYLTEPAQTDPFNGRAWYLYFYHLDEKDQPALGRAVLYGTAPNHVKITNLPGLSHLNYSGTYSLINNHACFFDLEARRQDRKLHIKVHYSVPERDEVLLGSYITYENNNIVRGSIVMEPVTEDNPSALVLSYNQNQEIFHAVNPAIKRYLLFKKYNYHKTPTRVHSYEDLDRYLDRHWENWKSHFIEEDTPTLFIASPGLSVKSSALFKKNETAINHLVQKLQKKFGEEINIKIHHNQNADVDLNLTDALQDLQKTRFFVLIYTKSDIGSYSLVQLGWALAHCKVVLVFYEEGSISERVKSIPERAFMQSFQDLEVGIDNIFNTIELQIRRNFKDLQN